MSRRIRNLLRGIGLLRSANAPEPYVLACHPDVVTAFQGLQNTLGDSVEIPPNMPTMYASTQINGGTAFLYSPSQLAVVRRRDATIEIDRSRLFNQDMSEVRGRMRVNLIAPNPTAIVKLTAGTATSSVRRDRGNRREPGYTKMPGQTRPNRVR